MKRLASTLLLFVAATGLARAAEYQLYVAGVQVTSANASAIHNAIPDDRIMSANLSQPFSISYDDATKTLTINNTHIHRSGSDNRAIYNKGIVGLTIVCVGDNNLAAEDSSPVRVDKPTTITSPNGFCYIKGYDEDAVSVYDGTTLTIDDAKVEVIATNSTGFWGEEGNEKLVIKNSYVKSTGTGEPGLYRFGSLSVTGGSYVVLEGKNSVATKNLKACTVTGDWMDYFEASFSSSKQAIVGDNGSIKNKAIIGKFYSLVDGTAFPDAALRTAIRKQRTRYFLSADVIVAPTAHYEGDLSEVTSLDLTDLDVTNIEGLDKLTCLNVLRCPLLNLTALNVTTMPSLNTLDCHGNQLTTLDLTQCHYLTDINCSDNNLTELLLPSLFTSSRNTLDCSYNNLQAIDLSGMPSLKELNCCSNQLQTLDLSGKTLLGRTICCHNRLVSIDLRDKGSFGREEFAFYDNCLKGEGMQALVDEIKFAQHPDLFLKVVDHVSLTEENEITEEQIAVLKGKNWGVRHHVDIFGQVSWQSVDDGDCKSYGLWVKGNRVTSHNADNVFSDAFGRVVYDADANKLTLKGETITGSPYGAVSTLGYGSAIRSTIADLTIQVQGQNTLTAIDGCDGLMVDASTVIEGTGELNVQGRNAVYMTGAGTMRVRGDIVLTAEGTMTGLRGAPRVRGANSTWTYPSSLYVGGNATVKAKGVSTGAVISWKSLHLGGNRTIVAPSGAVWSRTSSGVEYESGGVVNGDTWVIISEPQGAPTAIDQATEMQLFDGKWFAVDGRPLHEVPTQPGVYLHNGRKVVVN